MSKERVTMPWNKPTDEEVLEINRRIHKDTNEATRLKNQEIDPAYPARLSNPPKVYDFNYTLALEVRCDILEKQVAAYKKSSSASDGKRKSDAPGDQQNSYKGMYKESDAKLAKVRKLCDDAGFGEVIDAIFKNPEKEAMLIKSTKDCLALIQRSGGPDECTRAIRSANDLNDQTRYSSALLAAGLQPKDILKAQVPGTDFYTMATVMPTACVGYPTTVHVRTLYKNDGDTHSGAHVCFKILSRQESFEICVNNESIINIINSVFEESNMTKLYNSALSNKYTSFKSKYAYAAKLYQHTIGELITLFPEKKDFLLLHHSRARVLFGDRTPGFGARFPKKYSEFFPSSSASSASVQLDDDVSFHGFF